MPQKPVRRRAGNRYTPAPAGLHPPPGRRLGHEANVPFFSVTGSSFVEMFVGVGAARVRDLFQDARKRAPAIVFVDEIDAIGQRRGSTGTVANDEREQTLNQLLAEMDGFDPAIGVVVLAATNRPEILDPALLRPGRFDRQVTVPLPNLRERLAILQVHCRGKQLDPDLSLDVMARGTPGFSGADLANLVNEAAIVAVRANRDVLTAADFDAARDRIILGRREGSNVLIPDEQHAVAVHEAGHALVAAYSDKADPVAKVTILPAGQALGVTEQLPPGGAAPLRRGLPLPDAGRRPRRPRLARWCWARARRAPPTTSPGRPSSPSRWCASSASPPPSARWGTPWAARCTSAAAGTEFSAAPSPSRPRRPSMPRFPACWSRPRSAPWTCSPRIATCSTSWCRRSSPRRPWTVPRCTLWPAVPNPPAARA